MGCAGSYRCDVRALADVMSQEVYVLGILRPDACARFTSGRRLSRRNPAHVHRVWRRQASAEQERRTWWRRIVGTDGVEHVVNGHHAPVN